MVSAYTRSVCNRFLLGLCLALALGSLLPDEAQAQVLYGSLVGNVKDPTGAAIPGATVTITHKETNLSRETLTDEAGSYSFPTVPTGSYTVRVNLAGFKTFTKTDVPVTLNNITRVDVTLEVGEITESVTVTAETAILQTDSATVRAELTERSIKELPVPLGRNYQQLFKVLPGFAPPTEPHSIPTNPSRSLRFNVNGVSASINNTRIDGASSINPWLPHITAYVPALEAIEAVNVVTNSFDAEQGIAGGAAINVQLKSGTNEFHGSAFEYHHNTALRARDFFRPATQPKAHFVYNQYGGTFGGPIKKDRLFFFTSYEGTNDRRSAGAFASVPTLAIRSGDFSATGTTIYDPLTGNPDGSRRAPFPGNRIPPERIDPIVRQIVALIPLPNLPGETQNYFVSTPLSFDRWTLDTKVNWNVSQKFNMFGRFSYLNFDVDNATVFGKTLEGPTGPAVAGATSNAGHGFGNTKNFSVGVTYIFSPTFIVDGNFGFVRFNTSSEHPSIGQNIGLDVLKIPGTNGPKRYQSGWPHFVVPGYTDLGTVENFMPYYRTDDQFQYVANFNWTRRKHDIRWGLDIYKQNMNHIQPEFPIGESRGARGRFDFAGGATALLGGPSPNFFNSFATFLLGYPTRLGKNLLTLAPYATRNWTYSFYIRDRWHATSRLTLSYGMRWEYYPMPTRAEGRGFEFYDSETNKMLVGGIGSVPKRLGIEVSKKLFAPRFGIAYRATDTFVIRSGYGISIDPYPLARPLRTNYPVLIELDLQAPNAFSTVGRRLSEGIPPIVEPDLGNGIIDIPGNVTAITLPKKFNRGYVQTWNLTLQKQLKWGFVGEVGYVASRQVRQLGFRELNYAPIGGGSSGRILVQRFNRTAATRSAEPIGGSHYDSLQARLQRRFSNGYQIDVSYTLGKVIGIVNADGSDNVLPINIPEFYRLNRGLVNIDRTHNLQITNITELPLGKGKRYLNSGFLSHVVGGWQVNNLISLYSGTPFTVTASDASLNAPGNSQRADLVKPKPQKLGGVGPGQPYFDPFAFAPVTEPRFGTAGFNILRGPGVVNWDFGLFRNFRVSERVNIQFRIEAFNFTNTPHFGNPGTNVSAMRLNPDGTIRDLNGYSEIRSSFGERDVRFGLRVSF